MENSIVTADLSKFGYIELAEAGKLLMAYAENGADFLNDGLTLNFNTNSGYVFLTDSDCTVGMLEEGKVVKFYNCSQCGNEGTQSEGKENGWDFENYEGYCSKKCKKEND